MQLEHAVELKKMMSYKYGKIVFIFIFIFLFLLICEFSARYLFYSSRLLSMRSLSAWETTKSLWN